MKFVTNRDITVTSVLGHAIEFLKGVPTHVPPGMYSEVQAIGAVPEDEIEEEKSAKPNTPEDPTERKNRIFEAFAVLKQENKRGNFSGTGFPHTKAITGHTGFAVDEKERDALWNEFQQLKA